MVMGFSTLVITATEEIHLGSYAGISSGDMDDDGITDLVIAADAGGYDAEGRAWVLNGAEPWALMGSPNAVSTAQFSGAAAANYMGTLGAHQVDHVGSASASIVPESIISAHRIWIHGATLLQPEFKCRRGRGIPPIPPIILII